MTNDILGAGYDWLVENWFSFTFSIIGILIVHVVYRLLSRELSKLKDIPLMMEYLKNS